MYSNENQQALAWQQIIKNRAFYNVRVQRGESWVDAACRTLDEFIDQKEETEKTLDKKFAKLMSDYQDVEDERDEWKARALDAEHYAQAVSASNRVARAEWAEAAMERERDEWQALALSLERELAVNYEVPKSRADIDRALINVISNAMNYPEPLQMLGKDTGPLRKKCVDAVCDLFGVEAEQSVDPIEAKARELWGVTHPPDVCVDFSEANEWERASYVSLARYVLGRENHD